MRLLSIDCESNGLYGEVFAVSLIVRENGTMIDEFSGRCPIEGPVDPWVQENFLPVLEDMPINYASGLHMRLAFWEFWMRYKDHGPIIAHMAAPVETSFFRRCIEDLPQEVGDRMWHGTFPLHDVATVLLLAGEDPGSVDAYIAKNGITITISGSTHHPRYDAEAAALVWEHLQLAPRIPELGSRTGFTTSVNLLPEFDHWKAEVVTKGLLDDVVLVCPAQDHKDGVEQYGTALQMAVARAGEAGIFNSLPHSVTLKILEGVNARFVKSAISSKPPLTTYLYIGTNLDL